METVGGNESIAPRTQKLAQTAPDKSQRRFKPAERRLMRKVMANVVNFMEEDRKKFPEVFNKYDYKRKGFISIKDFE